jgi:hypothetical protein
VVAAGGDDEVFKTVKSRVIRTAPARGDPGGRAINSELLVETPHDALTSALDMLAMYRESLPCVPKPFFNTYFKESHPHPGIFADFLA